MNMQKKREMRNRGTRVPTSVMDKNLCLKSKRSQVTIFVIVAIIVVVAAILIYVYWPQIKGIVGGTPSVSPEGFIRNCLEKTVDSVVANISMQGGSLEPEHFFMYGGNKVEYLCYAEAYYEKCVMQQPVLYKHVEEEIVKGIREKEQSCFNALKSEYEKQGYAISITNGQTTAELLPQRIFIQFNRDLTISKDGASNTIDGLKIILDNNLYEHVGIATSILGYETELGGAETTIYMNIYPDLKVEKYKQTDGTTIYILSNRDKKGIFQFASRSMAWPPGYGIGA